MTIASLAINPRRRIQVLPTRNDNYGITKHDQQRDVKHSYSLRGSTTDLGHQRLQEKIPIEKKFVVINSLKRKNESNELSDESSKLSTISLDMDSGSGKGIFQCKGCKKHFNSHQALGGHRASHKKVKGCFASNFDDGSELTDVSNKNYKTVSEEESSESSSSPPYSQDDSLFEKIKSKVHECSICHRAFSSGQALGGHKRCHWLTSPVSPTPLEESTSSYAQSLTNLLFYPTASPPKSLEDNTSIPNFVVHPSLLDCNIESMSTSIITLESMFNFNITDALTTTFSNENQDLEKEQDEEKDRVVINEKKDSVDTNCGVVEEYSVKHANCGINNMKKEGVCASWLQIGISSSTTDHSHGAID